VVTDAAWTSLDPAGEALLEQARARRLQRLRGRERAVKWVSLVVFVGFVLLLGAVAPATSPPSLLLVFSLVAAYAIATKVEFEVASGSVVPTQLVLVPMLFLLPPAFVPIAVAAGFLIGELPGFARQRFHPERVAIVVLNAWHAVGAAAVFAVAGEQQATLSALPVLAAALLAQFAVEFATTCAREVLAVGVPVATLARAYRWVFVVDALLTPIGFLAAVASQALWDGTFLLVAPLLLLLRIFAQDRTARIDHALELSHAYRGTAFLLGDVVETDDAYTGGHSRDVVEIVLAVSDELRLDPGSRRRAELAALLHDVGKIRIPKTVIHKPGPLDDDEWALMRMHTVEGEAMLKRVGGLLGDVGRVVRSCHERWDGDGYPDGLAGDEIPVEARIVCTADALSAMTTHRSYRAARSLEEALTELETCAGSQFDPRVVDAVVAVARRWSPPERAAQRGAA
jgi:HD-GYP domain-containing protein (c-di-GMP phosphodiesterase class II)